MKRTNSNPGTPQAYYLISPTLVTCLKPHSPRDGALETLPLTRHLLSTSSFQLAGLLAQLALDGSPWTISARQETNLHLVFVIALLLEQLHLSINSPDTHLSGLPAYNLWPLKSPQPGAGQSPGTSSADWEKGQEVPEATLAGPYQHPSLAYSPVTPLVHVTP